MSSIETDLTITDSVSASAESDTSTESIGRRSVLERGGRSLVALVSVPGPLKIASLHRSTRIVLARGGASARAKVTRTVPTDWCDHQRALRRSLEHLWIQLHENPIVRGLSYVPSERRVGGVPYCRPEITVASTADQQQVAELPLSLAETNVHVPNAVTETDISIRRAHGSFAYNNFDCEQRLARYPTCGGLYFQNSHNYFGTTGFRVHDQRGEYMYTANHVVMDGNCRCCVPNESVYDAAGVLIGTVDRGSELSDWITLRGVWENGIWRGDERVNIDGWVTRDGLDSLLGESSAIRQRGVISGFQTGTLTGIGTLTSGPSCVGISGPNVRMDFPKDVRDGDSGGPIWWPDESGRYVITVLSGSETRGQYRRCGTTGDRGNPAYGHAVWRTFASTGLRCGK